jgi:hypothetical protein
MAAWPTQLVMDCAVTLNSRQSSTGVRPTRTKSTIWHLNFAGYGGRIFHIEGPLDTKNDVSTESGQLQPSAPYVAGVLLRPIDLSTSVIPLTSLSDSCMVHVLLV